MDKIFQPFFTTKPKGECTGLVLSLSYNIVKANGGEVTVNTEEGEGAEFMVILPVKINIQNMKVLVVDDERDVQTLFEQRFRKEIREKNLEFAFAFSGEDALIYLNMHEREKVLILSDINMPGMSGLELLRKIKEKYLKPPPVVMMITAYGDAENFNMAKQLGADDFITKPVDFSSLKEKLKQ